MTPLGWVGCAVFGAGLAVLAGAAQRPPPYPEQARSVHPPMFVVGMLIILAGLAVLVESTHLP